MGKEDLMAFATVMQLAKLVPTHPVPTCFRDSYTSNSRIHAKIVCLGPTKDSDERGGGATPPHLSQDIWCGICVHIYWQIGLMKKK